MNPTVIMVRGKCPSGRSVDPAEPSEASLNCLLPHIFLDVDDSMLHRI